MTFDSPAAGLRIAQPARGFRYTSDAIWLAGFALETAPHATAALDLGTGSGVVALLLAARGIPTLGIDLRPEWEPLWRETLAGSRTAAEVTLRRADVTEPIAGTFDLVVSNPPFFPAGTGPVAPDPWRRAARTESTATLATFVRTGLSVLRPGGRLCLVVAREREDGVSAARGDANVERCVRIGRRRSLLCLGPGPSGPVEIADESSDLVRAWIAATAGPIDLPEPRA